jgi:serine/threonine-protein kinase
MGSVYRAHHTGLGRDVAVKIVNPRLGAGDPKLFQRFLREVELLRGVDDPHVVRILDAGQSGRLVYAVMELVQGRTLGRLKLEAPGRRLAPDVVAYYLAQVARGLEAVHRHGIVHRDIKPDNIMIDGAGTAKIMDFGLARGERSQQLTMNDEVVGTPEYMAPEAIKHVELDGRADQYSLGVTAYELLTGMTPFNQGGLLKVVQDQLTREPVPIEVTCPAAPPGLLQVVRRLMAKRADARFPSAGEAAAALAPFACGTPPVHAPPAAPVPSSAPTPATARPPAPKGAGGWGAQARAPAGDVAPTRAVARPAVAPGVVPGWEDLLVARLLARHGVLPQDDLLERLRAFQDPARAAGAASFAAYLVRTTGLPERTAAQVVSAARRGVGSLRDRIALSVLRRAGRIAPATLDRVVRDAGGRPFVKVLVDGQLLRPDEGAALERKVDEALALARGRAIDAARKAGGGAEAVTRQALRNLLEIL